MRGFSARTLIECHDDIRTERFLDLHDRLRGEEVLRPITMRAKVNSIFSDFDQGWWFLYRSIFFVILSRGSSRIRETSFFSLLHTPS